MKHLKKITESIEKKELVVIRTDDWEGIYYNNKLIGESHSIDWFSILEKLGYNIKAKYISDEKWNEVFENDMRMPKTLTEFKLKMDAKKYNL
jgi:hypothetical protein